MSETSETVPPRTVDKSQWGPGPWQDEPDRLEWRHAGLPCLIVRGPDHSGHLCGYAAVPPGHPLHGRSYDAVEGAEVHCGVNYAAACAGHICHVPAAGEPAAVWWFGFDCGHAWDFSPALHSVLERAAVPVPFPIGVEEHYRPIAYVQAEVNKLAEYLAARHV